MEGLHHGYSLVCYVLVFRRRLVVGESGKTGGGEKFHFQCLPTHSSRHIARATSIFRQQPQPEADRVVALNAHNNKQTAYLLRSTLHSFHGIIQQYPQFCARRFRRGAFIHFVICRCLSIPASAPRNTNNTTTTTNNSILIFRR